MTRQAYSIKEAVGLLGISDKTVRRRLQNGELEGERVPTATGYVWRVYVDQADSQVDDQVDIPPSQTAQALLDMLREKDAAIATLQREKMELAGQLGVFTERVRNLNDRVLLLEAPKAEEQLPPRRPWWRLWDRQAGRP